MEKANARYHRSNSGGGEWEIIKLPDEWNISYQELMFRLKSPFLSSIQHLPEQAVNWDWFSSLIKSAARPVKVLNLFAYTGGASVAAAKAGASVTHVDSSKGVVTWAKENAALSGLSNAPIRFLVDDCLKFTEREIRRGSKYDAIIMDPPSYGRGPKGEIWKLEDSIFKLLQSASLLLSDNPLFFLVNSYTTGLQPAVLSYMLMLTVGKKYGGILTADEIGLPVTLSGESFPAARQDAGKPIFRYNKYKTLLTGFGVSPTVVGERQPSWRGKCGIASELAFPDTFLVLFRVEKVQGI